MARYAGVLLDLGGVVFTGDDPIAGSVEALARLREGGIVVRFLTNTTRSPRRTLVDKLVRLGIEAGPDAIFTPAFAARHMLVGRTPHLLVHPRLVEDFPDHDETGSADVVLVGDAGETFTYAQAFFDAARASLGTEAAETVMIGDDVEGDIGGALAAGLAGVLVRTGKYKKGDEGRIEPGPTAMCDDLAAAVSWILMEG